MGEKRKVGGVEDIGPHSLHPVHELFRGVSHLELSHERRRSSECHVVSHLVIPVANPHEARQVGRHKLLLVILDPLLNGVILLEK